MSIFWKSMLSIAAVLASQNALASNWFTVYSDPELILQVDSESIRRNGSRVKVWTSWQWATPKEVPNSYPKKEFLSEKSLYEVECSSRSLAMRQWARYDAITANNAIDTGLVADLYLRFTEVIPDSFGDTLYRFVCGKSALVPPPVALPKVSTTSVDFSILKDSTGSVKTDGAPPIPEFGTTESRLAYLKWRETISDRLKSIVEDGETRSEMVQTVWYESKRAGLDVALVLGMMEVASNFRKMTTLPNGSRGLMAVHPHWVKDLSDGNPQKLYHAQTNLRYGCVLLRHFLDARNGDLNLALNDYVRANKLEGLKWSPTFTAQVRTSMKKWQ